MGYEYYPTQNSHAKAVLEAGVPEVFLSVLVPFEEGQESSGVTEKIETGVEDSGKCTAKIGSVLVTIIPDGSWKVDR